MIHEKKNLTMEHQSSTGNLRWRYFLVITVVGILGIIIRDTVSNQALRNQKQDLQIVEYTKSLFSKYSRLVIAKNNIIQRETGKTLKNQWRRIATSLIS